MNPPQVYMCSPSWTLLPPPSPYHPSGLSQCTSPKHPVSCIEPGLATRFIYDIICISMPFSQIILPSPSPTESKRSVCFISHVWGYKFWEGRCLVSCFLVYPQVSAHTLPQSRYLDICWIKNASCSGKVLKSSLLENNAFGIWTWKFCLPGRQVMKKIKQDVLHCSSVENFNHLLFIIWNYFCKKETILFYKMVVCFHWENKNLWRHSTEKELWFFPNACLSEVNVTSKLNKCSLWLGL